MNLSLGSNVSTGPSYRDSYSTAVAKNVIVVFLGLIINYINGTLIHTFRKHQIFRTNPRYILFIHLVINDMIQLMTSITLFILPFTIHKPHVPLCCFLILPAILTTENTPLNIVFMAAECYIAVRFPLRHNSICTVRKTYIVIGIIWMLSSLLVLPDVFILFVTEPLEFLNSRVHCYRDQVFRSSFSRQKRVASHILFLVVVWFTLFYTYFRILFVAKGANSDAKKARNTIVLHGFQVILCMLVYLQPIVVEVFTRFYPQNVTAIYFFNYIMNHILPRVISPVVYGLRDKTFRKYVRRYFCTVNFHPKTTELTK